MPLILPKINQCRAKVYANKGWIIGALILILSVIIHDYFYKKSRLNYDIPPKSNENWLNPYDNVPIKDSYLICIEHGGYTAERELGFHIKKAAEKLGWKAHVIDKISGPQGQEMLKNNKIDFAINFDASNLKRAPNLPQYLCMLQSHTRYFRKSRFSSKPCFKSSQLHDYNGYLLAYPEVELLKKVVEHKKKFYGSYFCPSIHEMQADFATYRPLRMYFGCGLWDSERRRSENYKKLYRLLDDAGYIDFYGTPITWQPLGLKNWHGEIISASDSEYLDLIAQYGIALVLHSAEHLAQGIPVPRIFEAAAVGNIIICDKHEFVKKNFQDAVLYIDVDKSAEEIFAQIEAHMEWIRNNPEEAQELAKRAHNIFVSQFTLEKQLIKIAKLHEASQRKL